MNPEQIAAVRASWALAAPQAETIAETSISRLVDINPTTAGLFSRTDEFHASIVATLDRLLGALDDPAALVAIAGSFGRRHAGLVEERHFDEFRDALIETLEATLGARFTCELRQAWTEAYVLVASLMLRAMRRERAGASR